LGLDLYFFFPSKSGEFGPFFPWKILSFDRNDVFRVEIWRNFFFKNMKILFTPSFKSIMLSSRKRTETEKLASLLVIFLKKLNVNFRHFVKNVLEKKDYSVLKLLDFWGKKIARKWVKNLKSNQNLSQLPTTWKGASDFFFTFIF